MAVSAPARRGVQLELVERCWELVMHRPVERAQAVGDMLVAKPLGDQQQDLGLRSR